MSDLDELCRELIERSRASLGEAPSAADLAKYVAGAATEEQADRVRAFIARYGDLARSVAELKALAEVRDSAGDAASLGVPAISEERVDAAWSRVQARLAAEQAPELEDDRAATTWARSRWRHRAAAGIVLVLLGGGLGYFAGSRSELTPSGGLQVLYLDPFDRVTRGPMPPVPEDTVPTLDQSAESVLILHTLKVPEGYSSFTIELRAAESEAATYRLSSLGIEADGTWTVRLPPRALSPGEYEGLVFGQPQREAEGVGEPVARYSFRVTASSDQ